MGAPELKTFHLSLGSKGLRTSVYTTSALVAFAANALICRFALGLGSIDPMSFTSIRVLSGAASIGVIGCLLNRSFRHHPGNWTSALALGFYATAFSFAYVSLSAGTGALILFGTVQATMLFWGLRQGERPRFSQWCGLLVALAGLVGLMLPGVTMPSSAGAAMMVVAGVSWGIYSIRGAGAKNPVAVTGDNFLRALPVMVVLNLLFAKTPEISTKGALMAVISGAVASGIGYVLWYQALKILTATRAAVVQLFVPLIAALGGIILLGEHPTLGLIIPAVMIVSGSGFYLLGRNRPPGHHFMPLPQEDPSSNPGSCGPAAGRPLLMADKGTGANRG